MTILIRIKNKNDDDDNNNSNSNSRNNGLHNRKTKQAEKLLSIIRMICMIFADNTNAHYLFERWILWSWSNENEVKKTAESLKYFQFFDWIVINSSKFLHYQINDSFFSRHARISRAYYAHIETAETRVISCCGIIFLIDNTRTCLVPWLLSYPSKTSSEGETKSVEFAIFKRYKDRNSRFAFPNDHTWIFGMILGVSGENEFQPTANFVLKKKIGINNYRCLFFAFMTFFLLITHDTCIQSNHFNGYFYK